MAVFLKNYELQKITKQDVSKHSWKSDFFLNKNSMELKKQRNKQELSVVVTDFHIYILGIIS